MSSATEPPTRHGGPVPPAGMPARRARALPALPAAPANGDELDGDTVPRAPQRAGDGYPGVPGGGYPAPGGSYPAPGGGYPAPGGGGAAGEDSSWFAPSTGRHAANPVRQDGYGPGGAPSGPGSPGSPGSFGGYQNQPPADFGGRGAPAVGPQGQGNPVSPLMAPRVPATSRPASQASRGPPASSRNPASAVSKGSARSPEPAPARSLPAARIRAAARIRLAAGSRFPAWIRPAARASPRVWRGRVPAARRVPAAGWS